ncbi:MAG: SUMF1/EgtB/PvdO family nonheme iron enzyme, partial [Actinobacteria bacterium]|nr:SUMF1/EgtB/PvdO family nonheme iron enzyme [Actinomycetota bacterium]
SQAERELVSELNITPPGFAPGAAGIEMSLLGGDTDANAFLLAVGSVLIRVAMRRDGSVEANLQEVLNSYAIDLADGSLDAGADEEVSAVLPWLDTRDIERRLGARLAEIGSSAEVPDLDRALDQDRDGYVNSDDCGPLDPAIHPGAEEDVCNNLDDDCDGFIPEDADGDGFHVPECGGTDCDDGDPTVHPGGIDLCGDGVDSDCDGSDEISCFVTIIAGTFTMGSPAEESGRDVDETQHEVTLTRDFEILNTEVTQAQFEAVRGYNHSEFSDCPDCPVETVNWHEAATYCNELSELAGLASCYDCWVGDLSSVRCEPSGTYLSPYECPGFRLPTEAEWEYAARAGTTTATYNGDLEFVREDPYWDCESAEVLDPIAWYCHNSGGRTHAVGTFNPNDWGLFDMLGNVNEWCHDGYGVYPGGSVTDPNGPIWGSSRVVRGGAYYFNASGVRVAFRFGYTPNSTFGAKGFRLVRTTDP